MAKKTKICPGCKKERAISEFGRNIRNPGGRATYCKPCARERVKQWKADNPEKVAAQMKRYFKRVKRRNKAVHNQ